MALEKSYGWYVENNQIALVEQSSDGKTLYDTISTSSKTVKMLVSCLATDFDTTLTDDDKTYNLPTMFRRVIADLAISRFYELPPFNENSIALAKFFYGKANAGIQEIRHYANIDFASAERIVPHYF